MLEIDIVMSSSLFMLITYYSVMTDTNELTDKCTSVPISFHRTLHAFATALTCTW